MKKVLFIISILLSCLIFYNAYDINNYQIFVNTCNIYLNPQDPRNLDSLLIRYSAQEDQKRILTEVENAAKETESSVAYVTSNLNENGVYTEEMYLYIPKVYSLDLYLEDEDAIIDFSVDNDERYYTSDKNDGEKFNLITSYNHKYFDSYSSIISIYPFCQSFHSQSSDMSFILYIHSDSIEEFRGTLHDNMKDLSVDYTDELLTSQAHFASPETGEETTQKIIVGLFAAIIAYLIADCLLVSKERKKISIYRMEGYSSLSIIFRFYFPTMCFCIIAYGVSALCLCLLFTSLSSVHYLKLYSELLNYFFIFVCGNLLAMVAAWFYIQYTTRSATVDVHAGLRQSIRINYITKVIVALALMGGFCQCVKESIPTMQYYHTAVKYKDIVDQTQILDRVPMVMQTQEFGTKLYEIGYYSDFDEYQYYSMKDNPLMYEYFGERYFEEYYMSEPYLVCNGNYIDLMGNVIYDMKGNPIDVHVSSNDYLLVPQKYRSLNLKPYSHGSGITEVIYVKSTGEYVDINMKSPKHPMYDPIIRLKNQWSSSFSTDQLLLPKNETYDEEYYQQLMMEYHVTEDDLAFINTEYYYDCYLQALEHALIDFIYVIALYTFVFGMLLYQSTSAYVMKNKKRLAVSYLSGVPRMMRYSDLLLQNVSLYLLISVIAMLVMGNTISDTLLFVAFFGSMELLIQIIMLIQMERSNISDALKGD